MISSSLAKAHGPNVPVLVCIGNLVSSDRAYQAATLRCRRFSLPQSGNVEWMSAALRLGQSATPLESLLWNLMRQSMQRLERGTAAQLVGICLRRGGTQIRTWHHSAGRAEPARPAALSRSPSHHGTTLQAADRPWIARIPGQSEVSQPAP